MKRSHIEVLTTVYAREHNRASTRRVELYEGTPTVVLCAMGNWRYDQHTGVARHPDDARLLSHHRHVLPALSLRHAVVTDEQLAELLDLAVKVWPTVAQGGRVELPEHIALHTTATRQIVEPWVDYAPKAQARRDATEVARRTRDANVRVEAGARDRLVEILPAELLRGRRFEESYRAGTAAITIKWSDIELWAKAYAVHELYECLDGLTDEIPGLVMKRLDQHVAELGIPHPVPGR